ncbi:hypothetical protein ACWIUD_05950 [Helicobacter sp. 23-1044]
MCFENIARFCVKFAESCVIFALDSAICLENNARFCDFIAIFRLFSLRIF